MKLIKIFCKNTGQYHEVPKGATLEEVYASLGLEHPCCVTSCKVNNRVEGLHYTINDSRDLEFLTLTSLSGLRTYTRSLFFVLYKATRDLFPGSNLRIGTPVAGGYYCHLEVEGGVTPEIAVQLRQRMAEIVEADIPFRRVTAHTTEAIEVFRSQGLTRKVQLLESIGDLYTHYYILDDTVDYFYSALLLRTGQLTLFDLVTYGEGLLIRVPDPKQPSQLRPMTEQSKMFDVFQEQHSRQEILGCTTVGELNKAIRAGATNDLVNVAEALQEKQIAKIADHIAAHDHIKVVLIAGPSSSGKTTFSKRLSVQLRACGKRPVSISLDNYFVDREATPLDENGDYDFETIEAVDLPLFNNQMSQLLAGLEVELPLFDFPSGKSRPSGKFLPKPNTKSMLLRSPPLCSTTTTTFPRAIAACSAAFVATINIVAIILKRSSVVVLPSRLAKRNGFSPSKSKPTRCSTQRSFTNLQPSVRKPCPFLRWCLKVRKNTPKPIAFASLSPILLPCLSMLCLRPLSCENLWVAALSTIEIFCRKSSWNQKNRSIQLCDFSFI